MIYRRNLSDSLFRPLLKKGLLRTQACHARAIVITAGHGKLPPKGQIHANRGLTIRRAEMAADSQQIMCHRIKAGMHHFIVHGEYEYRVEVPLERALERLSRLAVHVTGLALRGSIGLRLERRHSEDGYAGGCQRGNHIGDKPLLVLLWNVFEDVKGIDRVETAGYRTGEHVVHEHIEWPVRIHSLLHVCDKQRIEVGG